MSHSVLMTSKFYVQDIRNPDYYVISPLYITRYKSRNPLKQWHIAFLFFWGKLITIVISSWNIPMSMTFSSLRHSGSSWKRPRLPTCRYSRILWIICVTSGHITSWRRPVTCGIAVPRTVYIWKWWEDWKMGHVESDFKSFRSGRSENFM